MAKFDGEVLLTKVPGLAVEGEIAFVLGKSLSGSAIHPGELLNAIAYVAPAIEIVSSRFIAGKASIIDIIADNAAAFAFVLGAPLRRLKGLDLSKATMTLRCDGQKKGDGIGSNVFGNPLRSALWLAQTSADAGTPLQAGDILLTGSLGPVVSVGETKEVLVEISGLGSASIQFEDPRS